MPAFRIASTDIDGDATVVSDGTKSHINFPNKFNRRYFGDKLFDRLMIASIACTSDFEHRIYNKNLSAGCG